MSRHFPRRGITKWDFEKGNLNAATKAYTVAACKRVKERGRGCTTSESETFSSRKRRLAEGIAAAGHPVGNHTYDHVNVLAKKPEDIQFWFRAASGLIRGKTAAQVIRENIAQTTLAMKERAGIAPDGFRTPGGFRGGLKERPDIQKMLRGLAFKWVSSHYPVHPLMRGLWGGIDLFCPHVRGRAMEYYHYHWDANRGPHMHFALLEQLRQARPRAHLPCRRDSP